MRFLVCVAAGMAGACVSEPDIELAYNSLALEGDPCPPDGCGGPNSPVMNGVYFWMAHLWGQQSPEGVRITGVQHHTGAPMQLQLAEGDELIGVGIGPSPTVGIVRGTHLINTRIQLSVIGKPYEIRIAGAVESEQFWVNPGLIWKYTFFYRPLFADTTPPEIEGVERALCSRGNEDPNMLDAIVFGGDLYNPDTKAILSPSPPGWVNIACVDSSIYKMHKIGYTSVAQTKLGISTSIEQRRAMLNAWTSKVCDNSGRAFTHQGEPITLRESQGLLPPTSGYLDPSQSFEAIWDENGAVCLNVHRLHEDDPGIYTKIADECGGALPPPCGSMLDNWAAHGHVVTGNPWGGVIVVPKP